MKESYDFNPEQSAFRAELIGNLKIDPSSEQSQLFLEEWAARGEKLVESGVLSSFDWNKEVAEVYVEADSIEAAVWVLKVALIQAIQQERNDEIQGFTKLIQELGADPDDLDDILGDSIG